MINSRRTSVALNFPPLRAVALDSLSLSAIHERLQPSERSAFAVTTEPLQNARAFAFLANTAFRQAVSLIFFRPA
jgi:hypothetical protein